MIPDLLYAFTEAALSGALAALEGPGSQGKHLLPEGPSILLAVTLESGLFMRYAHVSRPDMGACAGVLL